MKARRLRGFDEHEAILRDGGLVEVYGPDVDETRRPADDARQYVAADTATNVKSPANRTGQRNAFKSGASGGYYFVRWEGGA